MCKSPGDFNNIQTGFTLLKSFSFNEKSLRVSLVPTTRFQDFPQDSPRKHQSVMAMPITRVISKCLLPISVLTSSPSALVYRTHLKQHSPDDFPSQTVSVAALGYPFMVKTKGFPRYVGNQELLINRYRANHLGPAEIYCSHTFGKWEGCSNLSPRWTRGKP